MKAIMISDHPKWCALMMNGDKTVEVRAGSALYKAIQKLIDEYGYAEFYVYCTKGKDKLFYRNTVKEYAIANSNWKLINFVKIYNVADYPTRNLNGKVIFKFRCYKVEEISYNYRSDFTSVYTDTLDTEDLEKQACLTRNEFAKYLKGNYGCAIHISDLEIFDKPKELSEFKSYKKNIVNTKINGMVFETELDNSLTKAPQSWCYVEER